MSDQTQIFTDADFQEQVIKSEVPVLVDFWAEWCGPCQMQGPIVDEAAKEMNGKARVGKLNVDQNPQTAQQYGIMSIPTLLVFHNGEVVKQFVGVQSKEALIEELKKHV